MHFESHFLLSLSQLANHPFVVAREVCQLSAAWGGQVGLLLRELGLQSRLVGLVAFLELRVLSSKRGHVSAQLGIQLPPPVGLSLVLARHVCQCEFRFALELVVLICDCGELL